MIIEYFIVSGPYDIFPVSYTPLDVYKRQVQAILTRFDELKRRYEIPTQICVLAHVTTQMEAVKNLSLIHI